MKEITIMSMHNETYAHSYYCFLNEIPTTSEPTNNGKS